MKKTLIALAAVAATTASFAQVTLSGNMSWGVQNTTNDSQARFNLTNADVTFAAAEDLGGGLKANAAMTMTFEGQRSNATTVEAVTGGLSGGFGSITYASVLSGAAKLSAGVSAEDDMSDAIGGYAAVDVITYTTPALVPGLTAAIELSGAQGKTAAGDWDADGQLATNVKPTLIVNYAAGPLKVYADYPTGDKDWDLRGWYDLGVAKVGARMTSKKAAGGKNTEFTVTAPLGAVSVGYHYAKNETAGSGNGFTVSYALSKRTSVKASVVSIKDNAKFDGSNYRVQMSHSF